MICFPLQGGLTPAQQLPRRGAERRDERRVYLGGDVLGELDGLLIDGERSPRGADVVGQVGAEDDCPRAPVPGDVPGRPAALVDLQRVGRVGRAATWYASRRWPVVMAHNAHSDHFPARSS